jgi:hypothetical protein
VETESRGELDVDEWGLEVERTMVRGSDVGDDRFKVSICTNNRVVQPDGAIGSIDSYRRRPEHDDVLSERLAFQYPEQSREKEHRGEDRLDEAILVGGAECGLSRSDA